MLDDLPVTVTAETLAQLTQIQEIQEALADAGVSNWWLFGGWGLDARIGRLTRDHHDIEFFVYHEDGLRTKEALMQRGFTPIATQPPEESQEFMKDGVKSSSAYLYRKSDGTLGVEGPQSDWRFPANSFEEPPGQIGDLTLPAMSIEGMLAMKEQFSTLRNGRPLRDKDIVDIEIMQGLLRSEAKR
jgi:hypothetical protein